MSQLNTGQWRSALPRLVLGVSIFAAMAWATDLDQSLASVSRIDSAAVALGVGTTLLVFGIRAIRWRVLFNDTGGALPLGRLAGVYGASFFLGLVSPGRVGELARVWYARHESQDLTASAWSVVLDRTLDAVPTVMIAGAFFITINSVEISTVAASLLVVSCILAAGTALVFAYPRRLYALVDSAASRIRRRLPSLPHAPASESIALSRAAAVKALGLSIASQCLLVSQAYFFSQATGADANPVVIYGVVSLATFVAALPLSIGGLGTREVAVVVALQAVGFSQEQAFAFSLITLGNFMAMLGLSGCLFVMEPAGTSPPKCPASCPSESPRASIASAALKIFSRIGRPTALENREHCAQLTGKLARVTACTPASNGSPESECRNDGTPFEMSCTADEVAPPVPSERVARDGGMPEHCAGDSLARKVLK